VERRLSKCWAMRKLARRNSNWPYEPRLSRTIARERPSPRTRLRVRVAMRSSGTGWAVDNWDSTVLQLIRFQFLGQLIGERLKALCIATANSPPVAAHIGLAEEVDGILNPL